MLKEMGNSLFKCTYCNREFNSTSHHHCNTGFRKRHHKFKEIKQMEEQTMFGREFLSYEVAQQMHDQNIEFHAFGYWNKIGENWKLGQNALTLKAIKAPLIQQYVKFSN